MHAPAPSPEAPTDVWISPAIQAVATAGVPAEITADCVRLLAGLIITTPSAASDALLSVYAVGAHLARIWHDACGQPEWDEDRNQRIRPPTRW
jgi:hypothetical protein